MNISLGIVFKINHKLTSFYTVLISTFLDKPSFKILEILVNRFISNRNTDNSVFFFMATVTVISPLTDSLTQQSKN